MKNLEMPVAREFGWRLKPTSSSYFQINERANGQFCVVLNHALLRGVTSQMIYWWFLHFPNLKVELIDVPSYEQRTVPGYLLWHPSDHYDARLSGRLGPNNTSKKGAYIHIREAMQYDAFGWKFPVDTKVKIFYVGPDGWSMGREIPGLGPVMMLRIHFKDVLEGDVHVGVHYHYEVVIGVSGRGRLAGMVNSKISKSYGQDFFSAWHRHNVIEVGTFENFLPAIFSQRGELDRLKYELSMDSAAAFEVQNSGYSKDLFERRMLGYIRADNPFCYQSFDKATFL